MRRGRLVLAGIGAAMAVVVFVGAVRPAVVAPVAGAATAPRATPAATGFSGTVTATRDHLVGGNDDVVDSRTVTLTVEQHHRPARPPGDRRQLVRRPSDRRDRRRPERGDGPLEEYPVVLLECRGTDSSARAGGPAAHARDLLDGNAAERYQETYSTPFLAVARRPLRRPQRTARRSSARPPRARRTASPAPYTEHWVPFVAANGTVYPGGANGCGGTAPEAVAVGGSTLPEQHDLRHHPNRRHRIGPVRRVDQPGQRLARLLRHGAVRTGGRADHGHQLRRGGRRPARCRPSRPGPEADDAAAGCEQTGAFAPGQTHAVRPGRTARRQRPAVVVGLELAQPHHGPAQLRPAVERLRRREPQLHRRASTARRC